MKEIIYLLADRCTYNDEQALFINHPDKDERLGGVKGVINTMRDLDNMLLELRCLVITNSPHLRNVCGNCGYVEVKP